MSSMMRNIDPALFSVQSPAPPAPAVPWGQANAPFIAGGLAALQGGLSIFGAIEQNRGIQRSMNSAGAAFGARAQQINESAALQQEQNVRQREASIGRILTALAASGGLGGQSQANLTNQARMDAARNQTIIANNRSSNFAAARSEYDATIASLRSRSQNPVIAALTGAVSGAAQGVGIAQSLSFLEGL